MSQQQDQRPTATTGSSERQQPPPPPLFAFARTYDGTAAGRLGFALRADRLESEDHRLLHQIQEERVLRQGLQRRFLPGDRRHGGGARIPIPTDEWHRRRHILLGGAEAEASAGGVDANNAWAFALVIENLPHAITDEEVRLVATALHPRFHSMNIQAGARGQPPRDDTDVSDIGADPLAWISDDDDEDDIGSSTEDADGDAASVRCVICQRDPMRDPVRAACGHDFCRCCIDGWIASRSSSRSVADCPLCRTRLVSSSQAAQNHGTTVELDVPLRDLREMATAAAATTSGGVSDASLARYLTCPGPSVKVPHFACPYRKAPSLRRSLCDFSVTGGTEDAVRAHLAVCPERLKRVRNPHHHRQSDPHPRVELASTTTGGVAPTPLPILRQIKSESSWLGTHTTVSVTVAYRTRYDMARALACDGRTFKLQARERSRHIRNRDGRENVPTNTWQSVRTGTALRVRLPTASEMNEAMRTTAPTTQVQD